MPKPLTAKEAHFLESFGYLNLIMAKLQAWVSLEETTARTVFDAIDGDAILTPYFNADCAVFTPF